MKRRIFLRNSALAMGAVALGNEGFASSPSLSTAPAAGKVTFKKSIMWGTVGVEGSVLDKCKAVKAAGYEGIQPDSHMNRSEVIAAMKATGLKASSVCCSTHWKYQLSDPDEAVRAKGIEGIKVALEDAKAYGTNAVLVVPGSVGDTVAYDECWERSTVGIKQVLPTAKKLGVKICIENVWNNFLLSPMEACRYIDQFNSDYVSFFFDAGNILVYGWPEQWIRILGKRVGRIHVKEFSKKKADKEGRWAGFNVPLTEGDVNWKAVAEAARKYYTGEWFTTEQGANKTPAELKDLCGRLEKIVAMDGNK